MTGPRDLDVRPGPLTAGNAATESPTSGAGLRPAYHSGIALRANISTTMMVLNNGGLGAQGRWELLPRPLSNRLSAPIERILDRHGEKTCNHGMGQSKCMEEAQPRDALAPFIQLYDVVYLDPSPATKCSTGVAGIA